MVRSNALESRRLTLRAAAAAGLAAGLLAAGGAAAQTADQLKVDFARAVYRACADRVHHDHPQPLLRAVVVLRIKLDEANHWRAEVFRENPDEPEMTTAALESVARLPAAASLAPRALQILRNEGLIEAWLFQTDGRFALKSLAKPQRGA